LNKKFPSYLYKFIVMGFATPILFNTLTIDDLDEIGYILEGKIIYKPWYNQIWSKIKYPLLFF